MKKRKNRVRSVNLREGSENKENDTKKEEKGTVGTEKQRNVKEEGKSEGKGNKGRNIS